MMRNYFLVLLFLLLTSIGAHATTYTSAQNGSWMNFMTWSPLGVPVPGDIIIINHDVVLDTSFAYTTGSITVNASGSLVNDSFGRDIWLNGVNTSFVNNGTTTIRYILLSSGSFTNSGDFNVKSVANFTTANNTATGNFIGVDSLYNDGTLNNNGTINIMTFFNDQTFNNYGTIQGLTTVVDSMYNAGTFLNDAGALIKADSCTNSGVFTNNGSLEYLQYTNIGTFTNNNWLSFDDITNLGTFTNNATMIGAHSLWNAEVFNNNTGAQITLATSFLNADSTASNATFNNDGAFDIGDSFYNFNTITGASTGSFTMQDSSYNSGTMTGSFDFCDATPPGTAPYIDINLGTVDPLITYCVASAIHENELFDFTIYPNPTTGMVYLGVKNQFVEVYNLEGKKIVERYTDHINIENVPSGIYYLMVKDDKGIPIYKEKLVKE